jgi:hypothetical protein
VEQSRLKLTDLQDLIYNGSISGLKLINELQINLYRLELWLKQDCGVHCHQGTKAEATKCAEDQIFLVEVLLAATKSISLASKEIFAKQPKK